MAIGEMYHRGRGVDWSYLQAASWYRKAAEQGDATAQYNLALMYYHGRGVAHDRQQAETWFRKAAEQGNAEAQIWINSMY
jgi:TPR repeat protein